MTDPLFPKNCSLKVPNLVRTGGSFPLFRSNCDSIAIPLATESHPQ